ncbi:hypothetical protein CYMTET_22233, partial [Cymbomonas tetramitiformis]
ASDMLLGQLVIMSTARSASEVSDDMTTCTIGSVNDQYAAWLFHEYSGQDVSGHNRSLTITCSASQATGRDGSCENFLDYSLFHEQGVCQGTDSDWESVSYLETNYGTVADDAVNGGSWNFTGTYGTL